MKMHELLAKPENWTKNTSARIKLGWATHYDSSAAASWCVAGAAFKCYGFYRGADVLCRLNKVLPDAAAVWNDAPERTHAEVVELLRKLDV